MSNTPHSDSELETEDVMLDYGWINEDGVYESGQYDLLISQLAYLANRRAEKLVVEARKRCLEWCKGTLEHNSYNDTVKLIDVQLAALTATKEED